MLSKNDMKELRGMMHEVMEERLEMNNHVLKREIRDEVHSVLKGEIAASERRMIARMDGIKEEILDGVSEIIGDRVLPQIDDLDRRVTHLEAVAAH